MTKPSDQVSNHQVKNANRPWIGREEKVFTSTLRQLGAEIRRTLYFAEEQPSIENHFAVISTLTTDLLKQSSENQSEER